MATLQSDIEAITTLSFTDTSIPVNLDQLTSFIHHGVLDVTTKWLIVNPQDMLMFMREGARQWDDYELTNFDPEDFEGPAAARTTEFAAHYHSNGGTDDFANPIQRGDLSLEIQHNDSARPPGHYFAVWNKEFHKEVDIISVLRNSGTTFIEDEVSSDPQDAEDWRVCREIPISLKSRAKNKKSIFYASKFNPVFFRKANGSIEVLPKSSAEQRYKVLYVNDEPMSTNKNGDHLMELTYASEHIAFFPKKLHKYVVQYGAIKVIESKIASFSIEEEDSEMVMALGNTYNALKADYDQIFGLQSQGMQAGGTPAVEHDQSINRQGGEEE